MDDVNALCKTLDEEDIGYLQQCLQTISSGLTRGDIAITDITRILQSEPEIFTQNLNKDKITNHESNTGNKNLNLDNNTCDSIIPSNKNLTLHSDESRKVDDIMTEGLDAEDIKYLKMSFLLLQNEINKPDWVDKLSWIDQPPTKGDLWCNYRCARVKGFCKGKKLTRPRNQISCLSNELVTQYRKKHKNRTSCYTARSDQRRRSTVHESISRESSLLEWNQLKFRKKKLRLGKSAIHGLGVFAGENIAEDEFISEYVGEKIRPTVADVREEKYRLQGIGSYYFKIDDDTILDATKQGNINRYINHSCMPNSYTRVFTINNKKKVVIYSKRAIDVGEEITYDYKMAIEDDKIPCFCKTPNCKKSLN